MVLLKPFLERGQQRRTRTPALLQQEGGRQVGVLDQDVVENLEQAFRFGQHGVQVWRGIGRLGCEEHRLRANRVSQVNDLSSFF